MHFSWLCRYQPVGNVKNYKTPEGKNLNKWGKLIFHITVPQQWETVNIEGGSIGSENFLPIRIFSNRNSRKLDLNFSEHLVLYTWLITHFHFTVNLRENKFSEDSRRQWGAKTEIQNMQNLKSNVFRFYA